MTHQTINRVLAGTVFGVSLLTYLLTLAPTVVFWDVGEFIAASYMLQVPHPPGSPLFLLMTRIAMMFPVASDLAVRAHAFSALCSALGVMFLYLVTVRVILDFRGLPTSLADKVTLYGASLIGAFSLTFSTTYWFNSVEAEVYGVSMLFLTVIMWLAMRWYERADSPGNEKYLILIAYLMGLSLGVHLLALLVIFPVAMIVYFRKFEITGTSFLAFLAIALTGFGLVYPGIVKMLPGMLDGSFMGVTDENLKYIPLLLTAAALYGVYHFHKKKNRAIHTALVAIVLILIGYTTYTTVLIRSNTDVPMNENDPSDLSRLTSYLNREQYGDIDFWPRRWSMEAHQQRIYTDYSSEWDYLFRYQLGHMFVRYLGWNYIGQESDRQDAGIQWRGTFGIPLLMGLIGAWYIFKRDPKMGWVFLASFIILGPVLALYNNQQEPQPRERDYIYVGAFYIFSLWIAIGVVFLSDLVKKALQDGKQVQLGTGVITGLLFIAIPFNMGRMNWESHDRSGNYIAWDYSYNILQSCEQDAILFTNGDNDTFPLWYLQDVEGVRRDVRIVNLSLVNTPWYIRQLKLDPYYEEASPVRIGLTDSQIHNIQPIQWTSQTVEIPVPAEAYQRFGITDTAVTNRKKISWTFPHTFRVGQTTTAIRVQDRMVWEIIRSNQWEKPIYFAVTVAPDSKIGLDQFLWFRGLTWRLEVQRIPSQEAGIAPDILEANLFNEPEGHSKTPQYGYKFRSIADAKVYFDENVTRLMTNYRSGFIRLALYEMNVAGSEKNAERVLDRMEEVIPREKVPMSWDLSSDIASFYFQLGRVEEFESIATEIEPVLWDLI
ncbi:MAG: DUF2723 domain-containing protein, partial [Ignavibacteria bacterium]|nr:DUF2723 domain-containing protein [Ignavibacteria bacterium]